MNRQLKRTRNSFGLLGAACYRPAPATAAKAAQFMVKKISATLAKKKAHRKECDDNLNQKLSCGCHHYDVTEDGRQQKQALRWVCLAV
jgi:hypothetical protein